MKILKQNILLIAAALALLAVLVAQTHVFAQSADTTVTNGPLTFPADPAQNTTLAQRIAQRKTITKISLNATTAQGISAKCALAQTAIGVVKTKDSTAREVRTQQYSNIAVRLNQIVENLGNQGFDASDISAFQQRFDSDVNRYLGDVSNYKTTMDDLVNMDCVKDPSGFSASLTIARSLRTQLAGDVSAIKTSFKDVEKSLEDVKKYLPKSKATS
jgi:hypothetical protein